MTHQDEEGGANDRMIAACARGHVDIVEELLMSKACDPSAHNNLALQFAVMYAHPEVVAILLGDSRVDPSDLVYLLGMASGERHNIRWVMQFLKGLDKHHESDSAAKLLDCDDYHIGEGDVVAQIKVIVMLIADTRVPFPHEKQVWTVGQDFGPRPGPGVESWSDTRMTLLPWALEHGSPELVRVLLADKRACPKQALVIAAKTGDMAMVRLFMADPRIEKVPKDSYFCDNTALAMIGAARNGQLSVVTYFMTQQQKVMPDSVKSAIAEAAAKGHEDVVHFLLQDNANAFTEGYLGAAFVAAASCGKVDMMKSFIARDEHLLERGYEAALDLAAAGGHAETVTFVLDAFLASRGAVISGTDDDNPLNWMLNDTFAKAARLGNIAVLRCMMANNVFFMFKSVHTKVMKLATRQLLDARNDWELKITKEEARGKKRKWKWNDADERWWDNFKAIKKVDLKKLEDLVAYLEESN